MVFLFNTVDLLQRLLGAALFSQVRMAGSEGWPDPFLASGSFGDWNQAIERVMRLPSGQRAGSIGALLSERRDDFERLRHLMAPFAGLVGEIFQKDACHTLHALRGFGDLRNRLIGHGGVGTDILLSPFEYLDALHKCFLETTAPIAATDMGLLILRRVEGELGREFESCGQGGAGRGSLDKGLLEVGDAPDEALTLLNPAPKEWADLRPYWRFHEGRMIILHKLGPSSAEYLRYGRKNLAEPSYVTLPATREDFI
jgi:hypothetical protein